MALGATWAICSLALLLARPSYPFPPYELLDSWFYTGYQWDLRAQMAKFGPTYYGSRLSWILPGALLHQLLPPAAAEISFKLLFSGTLAVGITLVIRTVAHWRWAIIAVALAVLAPQIVIALQTDYVDGPVIVYGMLALGGIAVSRTAKRWPLWIIGAGSALAAMLVANTSAASTVGLGLAIFHLVWLRWSVKRTSQAAACYLVGALFVLVPLALLNQWCGGPLNFLQPQFEMIRYFKNTAHNPWIPENHEWLTRATWLLLPAGSLGWALVRLWVSRHADTPRRQIILALAVALGSSLLSGAIIEGRGTGAVMSLYYYASYHLVFALPLAVLLVSDHFDARPLTVGWLALLLGLLAAVALALPPIGTGAATAHSFTVLLGIPDRAAVLVGVVAFGALPFLAGNATRRWSTATGAVLLALWTFLSIPQNSFGYYGPETTDRLRERYLAVHAAYFTLNRELSGESFRYWLDRKYRDGVSLASTKLWAYRLLSEKSFPDLEIMAHTDETVVVPLPPGKGQEGMLALTRAFAGRFSTPEEIRVVPVHGEQNTGFDLLLFRLHPKAVFDPGEPQPAGVQMQMLAGYEFNRTPPYTTALEVYHLDGKPPVTVSTTEGYPVYHRVDPRDSLAADYRFPPSAAPGQKRVLALLTYMPTSADCAMQVQDDQSKIIGEFILRKPGRAVHNLELPADTKAFRICLASPRATSTALPVNITVYLYTVAGQSQP